MADKEAVSGFGLIIIGNEILDGRVQDSHFVTLRDLLKTRHHDFRYAQTLPDIPEIIDAQLRWCMSQDEPFFCCGGIGTTPDDHTRHCAARVNGVGLELHPEGVRILEEKFGARTTDTRMRLVEFPRGADLIPNPYNQVPGFRIGRGHYLPGFPEMATPMMEWVLDQWFQPGAEKIACKIVLPGAREADLVEIMESFIAAHPGLSFSSLPKFVAGGTEVHLGISGSKADVQAGTDALTTLLTQSGVPFQTPSG